MNVCLLNDSFPPVIDGVANVVMNYASIMTRDDLADVIVGTPEYPDADYDGYPYRVVPYQSFDTSGIVHGYRAGNPLAMRAIRKMSDFAPDIIHTHCPVASTVMARILRNETDAPIVFTYHTKFDVDIARAMKGKLLQHESIKALVKNISACDEVWTVSRGAGENLRSLGFEGEYHVVSNGVDFAKGRVSEDDVRKVTAGFDLPADLPVFLFVGRMMVYKGLTIIVDALSLLSDAGIDYRMVFVGDGVDRQAMEERIKEHGITLDTFDEDGKRVVTEGRAGRMGRVIFTGAVHDRNVLRAWNTRADLFLFPSTYDTNGIVVREAAACGQASVLIKDSCAAEGITDGRNGFLVEENAESMAAMLKELAKDKGRMASAGQHAMDEIYISWESAVNDAVDRYGVIIERKEEELDRRQAESFHEKLSDNFYELGDSFIRNTSHFFERPKAIYEGMEENVYEIFHEAKERTRENLHEVKERTRENLHEAKERTKENIHEAFHEVKEKTKENFHEIKTELKMLGSDKSE